MNYPVLIFSITILLLFAGGEGKNNVLTKRNKKNTVLSFLALGDSYTIGESVKEQERWPLQLKDSLENRGIKLSDPVIIATTGWRTDELKNAMSSLDRYDFDMVSLLIGVNNQYQGKSVEEYKTEFEELLNLSIKRAGGNKNGVFVVSIPDYGYTPFGKDKQMEISAALDKFNDVNRRISGIYGVRYFDITPISRKGLEEPSLIATDGLHPSGDQYALWVGKMMKDKDFIQTLKVMSEK